MTQAEKEQFKLRINEKMDEVKNDIVDLELLTQPIKPDNAYGRVSRMDAINNKSVSEAALRRAKLKLSKLEQAIVQVEKPGFGTCNRCQKPIQAARLMYLPESATCVRCAR